jgi:acetoin utilization deacetylase AcuC-like enzyme
VVWSPTTDEHRDIVGVWIGISEPGDEQPERTETIRSTLAAIGAPMVEATAHADTTLFAVHDAEFVEFLDAASARWVADGYPARTGQSLVMPYMFPSIGLSLGVPPRRATALHADIGRYATDTMTPIASGTARAARAAFDCALSAADLVVDGARAAYAAARPPGHHAGRDFFGGSCYLNNAAGAAEHLRRSGVDRVAIVDIDAHHGNGTQAIFYDRSDVWFGSVHVDPGAGWYPHFVGFEDETGRGNGIGANVNLCLGEGAGDGPWVEAVATLCACAAAFGADAVVVSLGVDAAAEDPNSPLMVTESGFRVAGAAIGGIGVPTVFVQEGGYVVDRLGHFVRSVLEGFVTAEARSPQEQPPTNSSRDSE